MRTTQVNSLTLNEIKTIVKQNLNNIVTIKQINKQGKILKIFKGKIIDVYDNLFLVKVENNGYCLNKTFTYTDFITGEYLIITN